MTGKPQIPAELPDDYKELQALAKAHGFDYVGVKKDDLKAALANERDTADERDVEPEPAPDFCEDDCPDPEACRAAGECLVEKLANGNSDDDKEDGDDEDAAPSVEPGDRVAITRTGYNGAWWCPVCDHSQLDTFDRCQNRNCGARRDGDEVVV